MQSFGVALIKAVGLDFTGHSVKLGYSLSPEP